MSATTRRLGTWGRTVRGASVLTVAATVVLAVMVGSAAGVAPKKGDNNVGFLHEKQVAGNGALTTEPLNWNSTPTTPSVTQSNSTFDNISGGRTYALQIISGTVVTGGQSANTTWITLQDNISSTVTVWVIISLVKMTFGSTTGFAGWGFIFIQSNSTGDYLGDSVISNFSGPLSSHLTKIESAYGSLATVNQASSNTSIKAFGNAEDDGVYALEIIGSHSPAWALAYGLFGLGTSNEMMPANIDDGGYGGAANPDNSGSTTTGYNNADCWSELLLFGLAAGILIAEIATCIATGGWSCIIVYLTINILPIPEVIAINAACGL